MATMYKDGKTVVITDQAGINAYHNIGWSLTPPPVQNNVVVSSGNNSTNSTGGSSSSSSVVVQSEREKRAIEVSKLVLDNVPEVAVLQKQSQQIYIDKGVWNTPEQQSLHKQAEELRLGINPMYPGTPDGAGTAKYFLPGATNTPTLDALGNTIGNVIGGGVQTLSTMTGSATGMIAIGVFVIMLMGRK